MKAIDQWSLLWRTLRHLRAAQIMGQCTSRIRSHLERHLPNRQTATPPFPGCRWPDTAILPPPDTGANNATALQKGHFTFLNRESLLGFPPQWCPVDASRLWRYNLHYCEWLWLLPYDAAKTIALGWIEHNTRENNSEAWDAYPLSLRLQNWIALFFGKYRSQTESDGAFLAQLWCSVFLQTKWLAHHTETHVLGNHLLENAAALALVGSCFAGRDAKRWLQQGQTLLSKQLRVQILDDGMHAELSPMYHIKVLQTLSWLERCDSPELAHLVRTRIDAMRAALQHLRHPDGDIALLNDSALGLLRPKARISESVAHGPCDTNKPDISGAWSLPQAGFYGFHGANGSYIICDVGPIGLDHQPGHAHGDLFSFEWSIGKQRVIIDSGNYDYEDSDMRRYCRSTRAHNTVELNAQDQAEFWGRFYVGARPHRPQVFWQPTESGFALTGTHDGYQRLAGTPLHTRRFQWEAAGILTIEDTITSKHSVDAIARFHIHPNFRGNQISPQRIDFVSQNVILTIRNEGNGELALGEAWYCPEFGKRLRNPEVSIKQSGKAIRMSYRLNLSTK